MTSKGYLQARVGEPRIEGLGRRTTGLLFRYRFFRQPMKRCA
jgi:hypothetical protein